MTNTDTNKQEKNMKEQKSIISLCSTYLLPKLQAIDSFWLTHWYAFDDKSLLSYVLFLAYKFDQNKMKMKTLEMT